MPQWTNYVHTWTLDGTDMISAAFFRNPLIIAGLTTAGTGQSETVPRRSGCSTIWKISPTRQCASTGCLSGNSMFTA